MTKVLIVHGAGMNMRGKAQVEIFGTMTLPEYNDHIRKYASELGIEIEIFHSNIEGEVANKLYEANDRGTDAAIINPAGYMTGYPALMAAISQVGFPTIELHILNPARFGKISDIAHVTRGVVTGFGVFGYYVALRGIAELLKVQ
jgi:3-dehydroquinate dehydratase-2